MAVRRPRGGMRLCARATVSVIAATAAVSTVSPNVADAATTTPTTHNGAKAAAGWLARQLTGPRHDHIVTAFTPTPDPGLTADAVLSMDAAGVAQDAAKRATRWLQAKAASFTAAPGSGRDPGKLAKLLLVAEAQRVDVHNFGGLNLVAQLKSAQRPSGAFTDTTDASKGDSPVSQALALIALSHTGSLADWPNATAISWLTSQQCGDGGFFFGTQATPPLHCKDVDSTAFAAQALLTVHSSVAASTVRWLRGHRNADGGYGLAFDGSQASNANSTAVTVQALRQAGYSAGFGLSWLHRHQLGCAAAPARRGVVTFDGSGFQRDSAAYATAQAGQALAKKWLGSITRNGAAAAAPRLAC